MPLTVYVLHSRAFFIWKYTVCTWHAEPNSLAFSHGNAHVPMNEIIVLLETYKYVILFPLAVIEGPILIIVSGFLVSLGLMNAFIVLPLVIVADVVGDLLHYALGRFGSRFLYAHGHWIGITEEKLTNAKHYFEKHHLKSVASSKLLHGIGFVGLIAAGSLKIPYKRFALTALGVSLVQSSALLVIGVFFGYAYVQIEHYLSYGALILSGVAVAVALCVGIIIHRKKA